MAYLSSGQIDTSKCSEVTPNKFIRREKGQSERKHLTFDLFKMRTKAHPPLYFRCNHAIIHRQSTADCILCEEVTVDNVEYEKKEYAQHINIYLHDHESNVDSVLDM